MKKKAQSVSIIIPTYNRSHFLERAIDSAYKQNFKNLQVILSNNASTDDTVDVITLLKRKYPSLVTINHCEMLSLSNHWDGVIKNYSTGDLIMVIPDDDVLIDPNYINDAICLFNKYQRIGIVFANYYKVNSSFERIGQIDAEFEEHISRKFLYQNYNKELFGIQGIGIPHLTALFSRDAYYFAGGFDLDCLSPDTYLWLKILVKYDAAFVRKHVAEYLVHDGNLSSTAKLQQFYSDTQIPRIVRKFAKNFSTDEDLSFVFETLQRMDAIFQDRFNIIAVRGMYKDLSNLRFFYALNYNFLTLKAFRIVMKQLFK